MSRIRPFEARDLFRFNRINLDHFTETYAATYYLHYLSVWPDLSYIATSPHAYSSLGEDGDDLGEPTPQGYLIGKAEGEKKERHGHVTAVTVAPEARRLGLAEKMMALLEQASSDSYDAYFIDLFVRPSNALAVGLYEALQYSIYRTVKEYYGGGGANGEDEDGYDMRKALPKDTKRETVRDSARGLKTFVSPQQTVFVPAYRIGK